MPYYCLFTRRSEPSPFLTERRLHPLRPARPLEGPPRLGGAPAPAAEAAALFPGGRAWVRRAPHWLAPLPSSASSFTTALPPHLLQTCARHLVLRAFSDHLSLHSQLPLTRPLLLYFPSEHICLSHGLYTLPVYLSLFPLEYKLLRPGGVFFFWSLSILAQRVKSQPAIWETWVRSLGREDPLEKKTATHSSILAWRIPWTEEPGRLVHGVAKSRTRLSHFPYSLRCPHFNRAFQQRALNKHLLNVTLADGLWLWASDFISPGLDFLYILRWLNKTFSLDLLVLIFYDFNIPSYSWEIC